MDKQYGWMRATFRVPCDLSSTKPNKEWIVKLLLQNPDLTGWPFFVDLWTPRKPDFKPLFKDGIWEAKLVSLDDHFDGIDHWRIDGKRGLFYAARVFEDDTDTSPRNRKCEKTLEFGLAILRTAEIIAIAIRFASFLCKDKCNMHDNVSLSIEWTDLYDRSLSSWANPGRGLHEMYKCNTDTVTKNVEFPLESSRDQIVLLTQEIVEELFIHFDGWNCPPEAIEDFVSKLLDRKL